MLLAMQGISYSSPKSMGRLMDNKAHWEKVYGTKAPDAVSWYAPHLETSLNLIHQASNDKTLSLILVVERQPWSMT